MDMQGNVWEWCQDVYRAEYAENLKVQMAQDEAVNASKKRVCRGGSFYNDGRLASASYRLHNGPSVRDIFIGFRVARALGGKP
jgi:formylglycine-generating enzyme required for sulfatase activity